MSALTTKKKPKKRVRSKTSSKTLGKGRPKPAASLQVAIKLIAILPTTPGVTVDEACEEIGFSRRTFYRLLDTLRQADIAIESQFNERGAKSYFIDRRSQALLAKLFGQQ